MSEREVAQLKHALSNCIPWIGGCGRSAAQESLAVACDLLDCDPYDYTQHEEVLTLRLRTMVSEGYEFRNPLTEVTRFEQSILRGEDMAAIKERVGS